MTRMQEKSVFSQTMRRHIPNMITLGNLLCGSLSVVFAIQGNIRDAASLILLGAFLDFFDGLAARLLHVSNDLGKQLDSLADMVTFGLAPTLIARDIMISAVNEDQLLSRILIFIPFIIVLLSALRLAKFNIDERQTNDFIGMPTPANALLWLSIGLSMHYIPEGFLANLFANPWVVALTAIIFSIVMVIEFPVFSLKLKSLKLKGNEWILTLLMISIILILILSLQAMPLIIILYLILSFIKNKTIKDPNPTLIA